MSLLLLLTGLIFALVGAVMLWDYIIVTTSYEIVLGKVIAFRTRHKRSGKNKTLMFYPVIEYIAYGNQKKLQANTGASWPLYDIGEEVRVYYSKKYDDGRLKSIAQAIVGPTFLLVGLGLCYGFWTNFEMSFFSFFVAFGFSGIIAWFYGKHLRNNQVKSIPELSQHMRNIRKKPRDWSEKNLITNQSELLSADLPGNKRIKFIGPIFAIVGLLAVATSIYLGINRWNFLETAELAEGAVVDYRTHTDDDATTYYPVVEYKPMYTSQTFTFQHDVGSSTKSYDQGATVPVLYEPGNGQNAIVDEGLWNWFGPLVMSLVGVPFFFVGLSLTRRAIKIKRYKDKRVPQ